MLLSCQSPATRCEFKQQVWQDRTWGAVPALHPRKGSVSGRLRVRTVPEEGGKGASGTRPGLSAQHLQVAWSSHFGQFEGKQKSMKFLQIYTF